MKQFLSRAIFGITAFIFIYTAYDQALEAKWASTPLHRSPAIPLVACAGLLVLLYFLIAWFSKKSLAKLPRRVWIAFMLFWIFQVFSFLWGFEYQNFRRDRLGVPLGEPCQLNADDEKKLASFESEFNGIVSYKAIEKQLILDSFLTENERKTLSHEGRLKRVEEVYKKLEKLCDKEFPISPFRFALNRLYHRHRSLLLTPSLKHLDSFREVIKFILLMIVFLGCISVYSKKQYSASIAWLGLGNGMLLSLVGLYYFFFTSLRFDDYRLLSPLLGYNNLAFYIAVCWFLSLPLWQKDYRFRGLMIFFSFLALLSIALIFSKWTIASLAFCFIFYWILGFLRTKDRGPWLVYGSVTFAIVIILSIVLYFFARDTLFVKKVVSLGPDSLFQRFKTWDWALKERWLPNPWIGRGPGTFHDELEFTETVGGSNSGIDGAYIRLLVEVGLLGTLAYLIFLWFLLYPLLKLAFKMKRGPPAEYLGCLLALLTCFLNGFFESALLDRRFQFILMFLFGVSWAMKAVIEKENPALDNREITQPVLEDKIEESRQEQNSPLEN